jgi:hypothetical protein
MFHRLRGLIKPEAVHFEPPCCTSGRNIVDLIEAKEAVEGGLLLVGGATMGDTSKRDFHCPMTDEPCHSGFCTFRKCAKQLAEQWSAEEAEKERLLRAFNSHETEEEKFERERWEAEMRRLQNALW